MTILTPQPNQLTPLYDQDFQLWLSQTISQLKNQQFDQLDLEHLIEELTDLDKSINGH